MIDGIPDQLEMFERQHLWEEAWEERERRWEEQGEPDENEEFEFLRDEGLIDYAEYLKCDR